MVEYYKSKRFVDRLKWVVVDETGKVVNNNPSKSELKELKTKKPRGNGNYNDTNTCPIIKKDGIICGTPLISGDACQKRDINGIKTDIWICANCYRNYSQKNESDSQNNTRKLLADCRTGNQNPNSEQVKGDNHQELACKLYGFEDLNVKNDNHKSP